MRHYAKTEDGVSWCGLKLTDPEAFAEQPQDVTCEACLEAQEKAWT